MVGGGAHLHGHLLSVALYRLGLRVDEALQEELPHAGHAQLLHGHRLELGHATLRPEDQDGCHDALTSSGSG